MSEESAMSEGLESRQRERYVSAIDALVETLTERERLDLFAKYCQGCGEADPSCPCQRDE